MHTRVLYASIVKFVYIAWSALVLYYPQLPDVGEHSSDIKQKGIVTFRLIMFHFKDL